MIKNNCRTYLKILLNALLLTARYTRSGDIKLLSVSFNSVRGDVVISLLEIVLFWGKQYGRNNERATWLVNMIHSTHAYWTAGVRFDSDYLWLTSETARVYDSHRWLLFRQMRLKLVKCFSHNVHKNYDTYNKKDKKQWCRLKGKWYLAN